MTLADDICLMLVRELEGLMREVTRFPDDATLWDSVPGVTNSAGNLALHVAGNLQHFVGHLLGGSPYVRDRPAEFATRTGSRASVAAALDDAVVAVRLTLGHIDPSVLHGPMPGAPNGMQTRADRFLLHLVAHTAFHLGQAGYLRRVLTGDATSAQPLPLDVLADSGAS